MHRSLSALLLASACGASSACTCQRLGDEEAVAWRQAWDGARAVVMAEVVRQSSEPATPWLSRDHVLGFESPLRRRQLLHLVVKRRWKGELAEGASFAAERVEGSLCGYERWHQGRLHLLYLDKRGHWVASLCSPSHPVVDAASAVKQLDAEIARHLGAANLPVR